MNYPNITRFITFKCQNDLKTSREGFVKLKFKVCFEKPFYFSIQIISCQCCVIMVDNSNESFQRKRVMSHTRLKWFWCKLISLRYIFFFSLLASITPSLSTIIRYGSEWNLISVIRSMWSAEQAPKRTCTVHSSWAHCLIIPSSLHAPRQLIPALDTGRRHSVCV